MKDAPKRAIDAVEALGFTALEALMYVELLQSGPQSGYRIAQLVGKAPANAYKSLESLVARGAVLCSDNGTKVYRAVPYAQVAAALAVDFNRRSQRAQDVLAKLESRSDDEGIYQLARGDQTMEHAQALIAGAKTMLLIDAFPRLLDELSAGIEAAAKRGVRIAIRKYHKSPPITGTFAAWVPSGETIVEAWTGEYLGIVADASSMLVALIARDGGEASGIATDNRDLAWAYYAGLYHDIRFVHLDALALEHPQMPLAEAIASGEHLVPRDASLRPRLGNAHQSKEKED